MSLFFGKLLSFFTILFVALSGFFSSRNKGFETPQTPPPAAQEERSLDTTLPVSLPPEKILPSPQTPSVRETPPATPIEPKETIPPKTEGLKKITPLSFPLLNSALRNATVNILCTSLTSGPFAPVSGSGVLIDPRGVILTNAHIAQYFLLKDFPSPNFLDCVIRKGSPAQAAYRAKLLYLPPSWIDAHKETINSTDAHGTGEEDYALLLITSAVGNDSLPASFPFIETSRSGDKFLSSQSDGYIGAAYSAEFLGGIEIQKDLNLVSSVLTLQNFFTFNETTVDIVSFGGNILAQKGSSGGGVLSRGENSIVAILSTVTLENTTSDRDLRAITVSHIERSIKAHTGLSLREYLNGDLSARAADFDRNLFGILRDALVSELTKQ